MPTLARLDVWDPIAGAAVALRAASHDEVDVCHAENALWWPAIAKLPTLRYDFFDGAFGGAISAPSSSITLRAEPWADIVRYRFAGARQRLYTRAADGSWPLIFDGRVTAEPKASSGAIEIDFAVDDGWLDTPLLALYAGTTGIEGDAGLKGQPKPLALGAPRYVAGKLIDAVNSVFQVSAYGAIHGVAAVLERLARLDGPTADYPNLAALVAASIPNGSWATCLSLGLVRLGAPPAGQISFLIDGDSGTVRGWARKPGALIGRLADLAGAGDRIDETTLSALDAARPYNLSVYLDQQTTARQLIQSIAASVNAVAGVTWLGKLFVLPVSIGAAALTLSADGEALPPVRSSERIEIAPPFKTLATTAARTWTVHALPDVAFTATLVERGTYDGAEQYREGHVVALTDGSRWIFVGTEPAIGSTPADGNPDWSRLTGAVVPVDGDGVPLAETIATVVTDVAAATDPNILTPDRKRALLAQLKVSADRYEALVAAIDAISPAPAEDDPVRAALVAMTPLTNTRDAMLTAIVPALDDLTASSPVDRAQLDTALAAYEAGLNAIDTALKARLPAGAIIQRADAPERTDLIWMPNKDELRAWTADPSVTVTFGDRPITVGDRPVEMSPGHDWNASADNTAANAAKIDGPASIQIAADTSNTTTTPLPKSVQLFAFEGTNDVTATATFLLEAPPAGLTAEINTTDARGRLTLTKADAAGDLNVRVRFPRGGSELKTVKVQRVRADQGDTGGAGAASASTSAWSNPATGTHAQITPVLTVKASATGTLKVRASGSFQANTANESNVYLKAAYRAVGATTWIDAAAEVLGSPATPGSASSIPSYKLEYIEPSYDTPGFVELPETNVTGLTASTDYEWAAFARLSNAARGISWAGDQLLTVHS